jgi:transcriptional regulator with XRE-family HTH domain
MTASSTSLQNYRPGTSRKRGSTTTFRRQMSDFARGARIRELRAAANLTREHLAHELGTTTKSVYAWENNGGIRKSSAETVAEFFGVPVDEIRVREEELRDAISHGPTPRNGNALSDGELELLLRIEAMLRAVVPVLNPAADLPSIEARAHSALAEWRRQSRRQA